MNLLSLAPLWLLALLAIVLAAAAVEDAFRLRISNLTCIAVALLAALAAVVVGPTLALWQNLAVLLALLIIGTGAFGRGWLGGGDVKLLAALGLWVGLHGSLSLLAAIFLAGGAVAILYVIGRSIRGAEGSTRKRQVPYGVAIAVGAMLTIWLVHPRPAHIATPGLVEAAQGLHPAR